MSAITVSHTITSDGFKVTAFVPGRGIVGVLHINDTDRNPSFYPVPGVMMVRYAEVAPNLRRTGVGTTMYELAAKVACETYKKPLASDSARSFMAEGFWEKQANKGRASVVNLNGTEPDFDINDDNYPVDSGLVDADQEWDYIYVLPCPPPSSLKGWPRIGHHRLW